MPLQEGSKILSGWQNYLYTSRVEIIGGVGGVERAPGTFTHESREMPRDHACCATCTEVLNVLDDHRYGNKFVVRYAAGIYRDKNTDWSGRWTSSKKCGPSSLVQ